MSRKEGKLVISFTQNQEQFVSVMNPDNEVIYTSANNKHTYKDLINSIYNGLTKVFDEDDIVPSKKEAIAADLTQINTFDKSEKPLGTSVRLSRADRDPCYNFGKL